MNVHQIQVQVQVQVQLVPRQEKYSVFWIPLAGLEGL